MMNGRKIVYVLLLLILALQGCGREAVPASDEVISFCASSSTIQGTATKSADLKTAFAANDPLWVYAWHNESGLLLDFNTDVRVHLVNAGEEEWDYFPHRYWAWHLSHDDFYDFLAVYGPSGIDVEPATRPLNLKLTYSSIDGQYDLMAAGYRRTDKTTATVPLVFEHLLSAVTVSIKNAAESAAAITLKECRFVNLISGAQFLVGFDGSAITSDLSHSSQSDSPVLGMTDLGDGKVIPKGGVQGYSASAPWDMMVPQGLDDGSSIYDLPLLYLKYQYSIDGKTIVREENILLKDIRKEGSTEPIAKWVRGVKYRYTIEIQIGGGILVRVRTTPWEEINAETPGLIIS